MSENAYKETQIFKPNGLNIFDGRIGEDRKLPDNLNAEDLFHYKNVYRDVKSEVSEGPIKTTTIEKITKVPKIIFKERYPNLKNGQKGKKIITKEVEIEKVVEVTETQEKVVYNEVKVPTYVDVPIIHPRQAVYYQQIAKNIPRGVELVITQTLEVPKIKPKYVEIPVPIYVPCYIEVPIPAQYIPIEKNDKKDYFTSGISNASKISKYPFLYNSSVEPQNFSNSNNVNPNLHINETKSMDFNSKCSIQNISSTEQKNLENMVIAGNL